MSAPLCLLLDFLGLYFCYQSLMGSLGSPCCAALLMGSSESQQCESLLFEIGATRIVNSSFNVVLDLDSLSECGSPMELLPSFW